MEQKMNRREARERAFLAAFAASFDTADLNETLDAIREDGECELDAFGEALVRSHYDHMAEINDLITARLKGWTLQRVPRVSVTICPAWSSTRRSNSRKSTAVRMIISSSMVCSGRWCAIWG